MSTITLGNLSTQASALQTPTMVVDETGHIVGMFHPMSGCPWTLEELERRATEPGIYTTQEVIAELKRRFPE